MKINLIWILFFYPNPANEEITIIFGKANQNIEVELVTINGKSLFTRKYSAINTLQLNLAVYDPGIYFIKILTSDGVVIRKFIKQ